MGSGVCRWWEVVVGLRKVWAKGSVGSGRAIYGPRGLWIQW